MSNFWSVAIFVLVPHCSRQASASHVAVAARLEHFERELGHTRLLIIGEALPDAPEAAPRNVCRVLAGRDIRGTWAMISLTNDGTTLKTDIKGRVQVPAERREALLDEFERSGLSRMKFAKLVGVKHGTCACW